MKSSFRWLLPVAFTVVLAGCATTEDDINDTEMAEIDQAAAAEMEAGASASGAEGAAGFEGEPLEDPASPLSDRVVYFEYDSAVLTDEGMELIEVHGEYLADNPERAILVEGHTDERGSREYNLALGERRAESVQQALLIAGADETQVDIVSYGEESPVVSGSTESAWEQNRRAELVYER